VNALDFVLSRQPWLITSDALNVMASQAIAFFDGKAQPSERITNPLLSVQDGVGIIRLHGPIIRQPDLISSLLFGATDTEQVMEAITEASARDDVRALLLDVDSPGGTVNGTPELAQAVADATRTKPVYAFSAGQMCSAAYWVASQCDAIYATPSARVGSIGVILPLLDSSEALKNQGLKVEVFAAGKFKSAGMPGVSLTDEQRTLIQSDIEEIAADFKAAVLARGRRIPDDAMEGQSFSTRQAQKFNLAGTARNRDEVIARLRNLRPSRVDTTAGSMKTLDDQLAEALTRVQSLESDATAHESLMADAFAQLEAARTFGQQTETKLESLRTEFNAEREDLNAKITAFQTDIERSSLRNKELEAQINDLRSREQDIDKRAAIKAAQIAAEMGSPVPARITPAGEQQPQQPQSPAAAWNRQFQPQR
jgi:signal peptide peptidase SppA